MHFVIYLMPNEDSLIEINKIYLINWFNWNRFKARDAAFNLAEMYLIYFMRYVIE